MRLLLAVLLSLCWSTAALAATAATSASNATTAPPAMATTTAPDAATIRALLGISSAEPVQVSSVDHPGWFQPQPPLHGLADPIDPLGTLDAALVEKGLNAKDLKRFTDGYVDRIEQAATAGAAAPAGLLAWLSAHPAIRREFWLALSPQFDDAQHAMEVLDRLRQHNAAAVAAYAHLAIAMAVVYDSPDALYGSRYACIYGVEAAQFGPPPQLEAVFDYFTSPAHQAQFQFRPQDLAWPLLVHLVDLDVCAEDRDWALRTCASFRRDIGSLYPSVPYDYDKYRGSDTHIGSQPYALPIIQKCGGVCGDQAHFTSRVSKCLGVPAMKVQGTGRYGRASAHAWCGFLTVHQGRPVLDFTGRYDGDYYYTGEVFDPQTRTMVLDRTVAMVYDGLSLSYDKYRDAQLLARAALATLADRPALSIAFARQAIEKDKYTPMAWRVLAYHIAHGAMTPREAAQWSNRMLTDLSAHPDLTLECLPQLMALLPPAKIDERQRLYNAAMQLYAARPDLQIRLRSAQCAELTEHGRQPQALELMLATVTANAKEGSLILPLIEQIVATSKTFAATNPNFHLEVVKQALTKLEDSFPAQRGNVISPAFVKLQQLVDSL